MKTATPISIDCLSEYGCLQVVGVCKPPAFSIENHRDAHQVSFREPMNHVKATEQHQEMQMLLRNYGVYVVDLSQYLSHEELQQSRQLVNRVFVRDIAVVLGKYLLLGKAGSPARIHDFTLMHTALYRLIGKGPMIEVPSYPQGSAEFGDILFLDQQSVMINVGHRTSRAFLENLFPLLWNAGIEECGLVSLPQTLETLHLDVVFNVISTNIAIAAPFLYSLPLHVIHAQGKQVNTSIPQFVQRHGRTIIWLPDGVDMLSYTNFLNLDERTILASSSASFLEDLLRAYPVHIISVDISELEKGAGGIRCLTLPLQRLP